MREEVGIFLWKASEWGERIIASSMPKTPSFIIFLSNLKHNEVDSRGIIALLGHYVWLGNTTAYQNSIPVIFTYERLNTLFKYSCVFNRP